jgi:F0F1-type ATP synthase assembly protein I
VQKPPEPSPESKELGYYFSLAQVGVEMVGCLGLGLALDHYLGWAPWGVIGGMAFGFIGGVSHLVMLANRQEAARRKPPGGERR